MKSKWLAIGIILVFIWSCNIPATTQDYEKQPLQNNDTWWRTYGGPYWDMAYCLQQTTDGGYIIAGESSFGDSGNTAGLLIRTDTMGRKIWEKKYGEPSPSYESIISVCQTSDGGYISVGYIYPSHSEYQLTWLVKTDADGNVTWNKSYQFIEFSIATSVVETYDEGFLAVGQIYYRYPNNNSYALLLKVDEHGNEIWNKTYGGKLKNECRKIKHTADGGFIVVGLRYNETVNDSYAWLLKLDEYGEEQWNRTYIVNKKIWSVYDVIQTQDGGYVMIGEKTDLFHVWHIGWMMKTDKEGNKEWMREYQRVFVFNTAYAFYQTSDGGYIVAGWSFNFLQYIRTRRFTIDLWLAKTDDEGRIKWARSLNKDNNTNTTFILSVGVSILQTEDGGYVVLGYSNSDGNDENDFNIWLIKVNRFGLSAQTSPCQLSASDSPRLFERPTFGFQLLRSILRLRDFRIEQKFTKELYDIPCKAI